MTATDQEEDDMGIGINEVRTVAVSVTYQYRALEFYVGTLGFDKRMDGSFGEGMRWIDVAPPGASTSNALVSAAITGERVSERAARCVGVLG